MKLKTRLRQLLKIREYISQTNYLKYVETSSIDDYAILLECQHGTGINGNIFYLLKELCTNVKYKDFKVYISVKKEYEKNILSLLRSYSFQGYQTVRMNTMEYYQTVATSKYLINDNTFLPFFIKRDEQVYLNTWHGTPLKTLGKKINNDFHNIGNTMKNFFVADYLLYPNEHTRNCMVEDYMLENIAQNEIVLNGYPRNTILFDQIQSLKIRKQFDIEDKKVIAYMPTWRGTVANKNKDEQIDEVMMYLKEIDSQLTNNQVMYVNFHPIIHANIQFADFKHIQSFPSEIETYEFLNACDMLITDYSSVFFDYAISHKKIILFTYDKEEYFMDRGVYISIDDLPFPKVDTVKELLAEINAPIQYDDKKFVQEFCSFENKNASSQLLDLVLFNERADLNIENMPNNGKENVLIYAGNFAKNGITSSLMNLLENIDLDKRNYYVTFFSRRVYPYRDTIRALPEGVKYIPVVGKMNASLQEKKLLKDYKKNKVDMGAAYANLKKLYTYEIKRRFGNISFAHVIHFTGYEFKIQLLFSFFKDAKKTIYVHSNMVEELRVRKNQHKETLKYAYAHYDQVAIVTEDMFEPTKEIAGSDEKFVVASNVFDYKTVIKKSQQEIQFDENTKCNIDEQEVKDIVLNKNFTKFINIGRFSTEKGHKRLISAFDKIYKQHPEAYLIIIGGHGNEYEENIENIQKLESRDHIILIRSMSNPFSILKECNCFAFTSFYEGLGLVVLEADVLGVPVFSTDILGPRGFIEKHNGVLVENNEEGIYKGFEMYYRDEIKPMNTDYEEYNKQAVQEFEDMLR